VSWGRPRSRSVVRGVPAGLRRAPRDRRAGRRAGLDQPAARRGAGAGAVPARRGSAARLAYHRGRAEGLSNPPNIAARLLYLASWFRLMHAASFMAHPTGRAGGGAGGARAPARRGVAGRPRTVAPGPGRWRGAGVPGRDPPARRGDHRGRGGANAGLALWRGRGAGGAAPRCWRSRARCRSPAAIWLYNRALTGDAMLPPQQRYMAAEGAARRLLPHRLRAGRRRVSDHPGHALRAQGLRAQARGRQLQEAPRRLGALLVGLDAAGALAGARAARRAVRGGARRARLALPAALFVATVVGYGLFFYHGVIYGARFYYLAWPLGCSPARRRSVELGAWRSGLRAAVGRGRAAGWRRRCRRCW
jgi:hypothetical protein